METIVKTRSTEFDKAASDITTAAENLRDASLCLRMSYTLIGKQNTELSEIRASIYKRARLYTDKVMPFNKIFVESIKDFCDMCIDEDYQLFKETLGFKVNEAKVSKQVCKFAVLFHNEILMKFKEINDKSTKLKRQMNLDEEYNKEIESLMSSSKDRFSANQSITSPIFENKGGHITVNDAMDILTDSIGKYVDSLGKIAGFFEILFNDLQVLYRRIKSDPLDDEKLRYIYMLITKYAYSISNSCRIFISKLPESHSNIHCIVEEGYDKNCSDGWIQKVVEKAHLQNEFKELLNANPYLMYI